MGIAKRIYCLVIFTFLSGLILAQEVNYKSKYELGKDLFEGGEYGLAKKAFEEVFNGNENPYINYAVFYHALSSWQLGFPYLTRDRLLMLKEKTPDWEQMSEVNYWLIRSYFEQRDYDKAFTILKEPQHREMEDLLKLQSFYINKLQTSDTLSVLYSKYPEDTIISNRLLEILKELPPLEVNMELYNELVSKVGEKGEFPYFKVKDTVDVGVLFPFLSNELEVDENEKVNEFVLDIYRGLRLASENLSVDGKNVNLRLYDTYRNRDSLLYILGQPELKNLDLLIGPLFYGEILNTYLPLIRVNAINPLSKNTDLIEGNPYHYLYSQITEYAALKMADYVNYSMDSASGFIFYGDSKRDSISAYIFKENVEKDSLINIDFMLKVNDNNLKQVIKVITGTDEINDLDEELEYVEGQDSIDFVYVASSDVSGRLYSNVLSAIDARLDTIEVLAGRNWLDDKSVDLNILDKLNVILPGNDLFDTYGDNYDSFFQSYTRRYGSVPTKYSALGFELMYFFGKQLLTHGKYFNKALKAQDIQKGYLTYGFDYSGTNFNAYVPLIEWDGNKIVFKKIEEKSVAEKADEEGEK